MDGTLRVWFGWVDGAVSGRRWREGGWIQGQGSGGGVVVMGWMVCDCGTEIAVLGAGMMEWMDGAG